MKNVLLRARILSVSTISACTFFGASSLLFSQSRDFNAERFILDDNAGDGTRNTLLLQVPVTGLTANRTLTLPDADGTVVTVGPGGLTANQILFGGAAGQVEQSANLLWDNTTSIFSIGGGLFTVDGTTGNTVIAGTLDQQGAVSNSTGDVVVNDDANVTGSLDVDTDLNVDGTSTLVGALDAQAAGNTIGDGTDAEQLEVQGVDGGAVEVDINGDADISGTLTVGTLVFAGDLDMNDNDIFDIDELRGNSTTGDLNINTTNTGDVNLGGGSGAVNVSGDLNVTGGTATFPVTAAQGDALIASTNAGTTTIDAVRIGTGLTDAQVNDNLTIDGGTVDATPIGGTTPSTGAFTTITGTTLPAASTSTDLVTSNGGALETRTAASLAGEIGVVTDATLTGDGTTGDPLGIDLANANTWTGTQTLPVTAAQGDALIASTNAGTTTVDAARIGAGLTDAQVNDNLTIDGGTVDATPIGGTTPSTGAFTTLTGTTITGTALPAASTSTDVVTSNGGALETRTAASLAGEIGVVTDATLTGDGTTGDPLGIDLANANTWTGTQTLPVTAAQGDALIASTNAGTTTVDAARIGAGLTDAQVNDNLTIDGGTIDATPIGATTPSTGAFTTITGTTLPAASTSTDVVTSNGGALETRTAASLAGEIGVVTDATLTGDGTTGDPLGLDLANANTWTGTQTLPVTAAQGDALIASTNAGTTTVDAARIGAGLTDAQVNDNLTIDGGTVDATPIGGTTPSTGAFTTLTGTTITGTALPAASTSTDVVTSNGGALETRTAASLAGEIGVVTDATLTGDGTTGDPLGLDLTNANTWTGTQTLPVTAAQGDALIASTNAGTTTVDAARIGAGLTDAQVNDNLTIDGGTVDATPIGATTPSTGAFTTITGTTLPAASTSTDVVTSNGGALETRTAASLAGEIGVVTDATLTGDGTTGDPLGLDLTNANTWTGTQTLPVTAAQGDALIASTNAGTTTVDAARIGAGLTDAQVNDNLTIDGGTVDASPIGATTPSTGAFTTITGTTLPAASTSTDVIVSNGGALETRTAASLAGEIGVVTDATLTGDGTTGDPLGIDLANANTWTGTQTLPVTAAQGDALIASTNAGTTTVDAARIGAGLTDAQVNDNLTIDGGTVDATPIGATTPSTGAFTTLTGTTITGTALPAASTSTDVVTSNGGALETRTAASLAGEIGVVTDATLTGDGTTGDPLGLDLANANTWTGTQTLPVTAAQGDALIASTNAGTTTVDAARIGAGLTDAQVNDNLTIDGGTVDATPIGATTPSTGAFTTLTGTTITGTALPAASTSTDVVTSNGGALETRTAASLAGEIGVVTDATLTGDGTTGDPLGIDLTNANTWTGTQTLPTTAAQGDALIASTNAGTTTVDAARIGAGLTDAQVNDNLTIDGGTVDATPIGATTPSTGAFTTITGTTLPAASTSTDIVTSNGGALETRTLASLAGEIGVSTDATLTGDGTTGSPLGLDLANANTWTGTQTLPTTAAQGDALIASTNAGTTTVDAARIGAGLTDAQVNDNLTIDGGTVDATPVGATTPSTGAFTTITGTALPAASTSTDIVTSNGGALETRTLASLAGEIGVSTDATLTGDGTTGDPLGIDLTNANTWTGTQTLPTTAAQGDALIASTNAGTTTVDAARIGAGLTDAQVNDNLTINGGTVDATPIGATTPSTGAFTTITGTTLPAASTSTDIVTSNGGALETRTLASLAGEIGVSTDATLTGDGTTGDPLGLDLTNANTWTGTQTLPTTAAQGDALIASTNAGTTTVDAARIGAGLTDAQVNDNLTIDGGTVDATPVGATTPSTGAFTTLTGTTITGTALPAASTSTDIVTSNGGALETRTLASLAGEIGVSTDATLTGDGTTGDPLGLDLTNANTWTGTQTLPVTAAQGDALIASTNAGTTTVDAARIGAGLTDAQVNDNLTINGGTVDATPIGGTTPSTGAFTTLTGTTITGTALPAASTSTDIVTSNGGALETRTLASLAGEIGVIADATLTGDGTTGSPLGLNLANANTWTGTQTLPTTAAQGDALIASTNAGTTTVDAARIGAGLTDAQVNDNLTIDGGTVDATPIGATTPSTGAFTTLTGTTITGTALPAASTSTDIVTSNGGALETRTAASLAGEIGVSTDATLTGDGTTGDPLGLNLANANTWTGTQTLPTTAAQGDALIASTNAGTTTVDAARIGAGLTDAQVNDNLTIDGGTVDATPVGGTTPSTGAFTTLTGTTITGTALPAASTSTDIVTSNGGALETRTLASLAGEIAVSTDATLTGDGTTGDPLGLDLANANTWTGTQTLPVTAAQGDALIASTNAGTTTVDAARIGAGLTDAQVNDNLTINGGTVDATPVGATTPSTGAFTTITGTALPAASTSTDIVTSNGGALETRTLASLAGEIGVIADATLTGDGTTGSPLGLNLANANTWTGTQTLPVTAAQGDALIASTNAGTTTVDAARIGAGLTDAQVNDNLTINGGTVDATPIGATTPSTGAFTTLTGTTITGTALPAASTSTDIVTSNGGALETRTLASLAGEIGVIADATLTGDGTTGSPLGLNLANANTWTGTQTLPVTAAQGDALIASTNAGTTTVDAARIGAGLTDAQVNDNLTINGGTVDATPIGATTPSTGVFTTLTATSTSDLQGAISNSTGNLAINDEVDVTGSIVPTADDTYNLGSSTNRWAEVFVNGATVHIGSDADEAEVRFNAGTGLEIDGDDNGTADLTIDGTTGNVGIAGDLTVSGTFTSAGFTFSPTEIDMNGGDIVDVDDLQFSQATSDISNTAADVVVDDNLNVTGNTDLDGTLNVNGITTLGDGDDNVTVNVGTGDLALAGIDAGAAGDELLTINTGTNVVGRRAFATAVDQGITHDAVNGEFVLGADASGTNPITTGRFVTVNNQLTFDGSGMIDFQAPTLRLGETGTTALSIGNSGTAHTIAGNNMTGTFGGQVALTSEADISINHSLTGGGITTQATSAVSSSGATMNATYTSAGISDLSELLLDATTVSAVSYNDDGVGNLTNYFELTADHSAQTLLVTLIDDINTPGNVIEVSADNPSNTLTMTTTDQTGSASVSLVGTSGSEAVTISAGTGSLAVEPTQTTVTGDLSVPAGNVSVTGDVAVTGSTTISNAGGVGLEVTSGGVLLSYSSGAPATIPDDVAVFEVDDATGASAPTVALPAGGANGQILYIYVSDPDGATVGGNAQAAGDKLTYIYAGGAWQLFHVN